MNIHVLAQKFYEYSISIRGYSDYTIRRYKNAISVYANYAKIDDINEVTEENVRNLFFYGRTSRDWSASTFHCYHKSLLVFFRWCIEEGHMIKANPLLKIETPRIENRLPKKLTKQETLRLLEVVDNYPWPSKLLRHRNYAIFATLIFCGLRKQELLNLKYTDVDIENRSVFVKLGKGNKDRVVPMTDKLAVILTRYLTERMKTRKTCPEFFVSCNKNVGLNIMGLKNLTNRIKNASQIDFTVHKLRHSYASLMIQGGCDIYSLSRMMGHASISTTQIYLYSSLEELRLQIAKHPLNDI